MDVTAAIIVLIFVLTIFSSSVGGPKQAPHQVSVKPKISTQTGGMFFPDTTYASVAGQNLEARITNLILIYAPKASAQDVQLMAGSLVKYGRAYNTNPKLIAALISRESAFKPRAVSATGALGLGQLMPFTAESVGVSEPFDIEQNIMGTTRYMRLMLDRWEGNPAQVALALASYKEGYYQISGNGGEYTDHTRYYIEKILENYKLM